MFIAKAEVDYHAKDVIEKLDAEQYAELRSRVPGLKLPEAQDGIKSWYSREGIMDDQEVDYLTRLEIPVTIHRLRGLRYGVEDWKPLEGGPQGAVNYHVSVTGIGLLQIQAVTYVEDACTDAIQDMLDKDWRILAVCPPNDARRPTYILGHAEKGVK